MGPKEGVIKFNLRFEKISKLDELEIKDINAWRIILYNLNLIGQNPNKYDSAGYGNLSKRLEPYKFTPNKKRFLVTGTQTSNLEILNKEDYSVVSEYYPENNIVVSEGPAKPSSESMSHGTIYDRDSSARYVFHVHSPDIWLNSKSLNIPITDESVEYGTPQMADEILKLFRDKNLIHKKIFSMGGHEDGVISFGSTSEGAGLIMLKYYVKALEYKFNNI